jgi:hypothetical protein
MTFDGFDRTQSQCDGQTEAQRLYAWLYLADDGVERIVNVPGPQGVPMALVATGEGIARRLADEARDFAEQHGVQVRSPSCSTT